MGFVPRKKHLLLSALLILASINLVRTTIGILKSSKRLEDAQNEVSLLEQEKVALQKSNEYKKSEEFIEKTAREDLNMVKPGESVYVVKDFKKPSEKSVASVVGNVLSAKSVKLVGAKTSAQRAENLRLWWELFF